MINTSRKEVRQFLAGLLQAALVGDGLPVQAVYDYRIGDFQGKSPVVVISSKASDSVDLTFQGSKPTFEFIVYTFVLYADGSTWTEADAENALDDIDEIIRQTLSINRVVTGYWESVTIQGASVTGSVEVGGVEYRTEQKTVLIE